mmetsp:Transcript_6475/g.20145  ORF Transcript_6475/g.20145 Transcript_6475/m.20145 type:complete len:297 (+) Transcript_6475:586-1476(+)
MKRFDRDLGARRVERNADRQSLGRGGCKAAHRSGDLRAVASAKCTRRRSRQVRLKRRARAARLDPCRCRSQRVHFGGIARYLVGQLGPRDHRGRIVQRAGRVRVKARRVGGQRGASAVQQRLSRRGVRAAQHAEPPRRVDRVRRRERCRARLERARERRHSAGVSLVVEVTQRPCKRRGVDDRLQAVHPTLGCAHERVERRLVGTAQLRERPHGLRCVAARQLACLLSERLARRLCHQAVGCARCCKSPQRARQLRAAELGNTRRDGRGNLAKELRILHARLAERLSHDRQLRRRH